MAKPMPEIRKRVLDELFDDWEDYKHHFNSVNLKVATLEKLVNKTIKATVEKLERENNRARHKEDSLK